MVYIVLLIRIYSLFIAVQVKESATLAFVSFAFEMLMSLIISLGMLELSYDFKFYNIIPQAVRYNLESESTL